MQFGPRGSLLGSHHLCKDLRPIFQMSGINTHLGDRILGAPPFIQPFPSSERALTLPEVQELQTWLTKAGFDTGGTDGRVEGGEGLSDPYGYGGLKVLAKLRQGS